MRRRFPLYARILSWFFLNLLLLATAFLLVFAAQFRLGPDWMLTGAAGDRVEAVANILLADLRDHPRSEWNGLVERFSTAYQVEFVIFRNDGSQLAGQALELPPSILARVREGPGAGRRRLPPEPPEELPPPNAPGMSNAPNAPPPPGPPDRPGQAGPPGRSSHPRAFAHSRNPTRYWVLIRSALREPDRFRPVPVTVLAMSKTLSGGGLIFDFKPWLGIGVGSVLFSAIFWLPLVRGITRSIAQMTLATQQIAEGRFEVRVDQTRRDELGSPGRSH